MTHLSDLLELFRKMEVDAAGAYQLIARRSEGQIAEVCQRFAIEEAGHAKVFASMSGDYKDIVIDLQQSPEINDLLQSAQAEGVQILSGSVKDLFLKALQAEKNSINFYSQLKEMLAESLEMSNLLDHIIQMEKNHMYTVLKILHEQV